MKKRCLLKKTGLVAMVMVMTALVQAQAVDMAAASGILADIAVMAVQAKANLAVAANSGDVDAIADATKRADAVDAAMAEALEAFATLENNPDDIGAIEDMEAARQKADDALNGAVPEATPESMHVLWKESQENTGGGPGRAYDPPNIYDRPWHSQGLRHFYQGVFGNAWSASAHGGSHVFGDRDATPE